MRNAYFHHRLPFNMHILNGLHELCQKAVVAHLLRYLSLITYPILIDFQKCLMQQQMCALIRQMY